MSTAPHNVATSARDYLVSDFQALHKQRRNVAIGSIVLVLVVFGYMTWLWSAVRYIVQPDNLASAMAGFVETSLPDWKRSAKAVVKEEAPKVAKFMGDAVVTQLPPVLRTAVETMVMEYTVEIAGIATKNLNDAFEDMLTGAKEQLRQAATSGVEEEQSAIMARALDQQIEKASKADTANPFEEPLALKLEKSQQALTKLNDKLEKLLDPKHEPDTRRGKLERRFMVTFWRFMQQENPDLRVHEGPAAVHK